MTVALTGATYLQDLPCDKLVTGLAFHPEEPLVVLFTVRSAIPATQKGRSAPDGAEGQGDARTIFLGAPLHRVVAGRDSPPPSIRKPGELVRHDHKAGNQTMRTEGRGSRATQK